MQKASKQQIAKFHVLLNQFGIMEQKTDLVTQFSGGRVASSKELSIAEASNLLKYLSKFDPLDGMRNKIFSLAYQANIIWGETLADKKMNSIKLDNFLIQRGTVKKALSKMNKNELLKTVNQFSEIVKHQEETNAGAIVKNLFEEMGIMIETKSSTTLNKIK